MLLYRFGCRPLFNEVEQISVFHLYIRKWAKESIFTDWFKIVSFKDHHQPPCIADKLTIGGIFCKKLVTLHLTACLASLHVAVSSRSLFDKIGLLVFCV